MNLRAQLQKEVVELDEGSPVHDGVLYFLNDRASSPSPCLRRSISFCHTSATLGKYLFLDNQSPQNVFMISQLLCQEFGVFLIEALSKLE